MPNFANPFSGNVDRKMNMRELIRALRLGLAAEEEAICMYESHADATDEPLVKKVLLDIADEERVHVGEIQALINILTQGETDLLQEGEDEVEEMAKDATVHKMKNIYKSARLQALSQSEFPELDEALQNAPGDDDDKNKKEKGLSSKQLARLVAQANAQTAFIAHMLGIDPIVNRLIIPVEEAIMETDQERERRNARRRELKKRLQAKKFADWGGTLYDAEGRPLSGNQAERLKADFKKRFDEYLKAGTELVIKQSPQWRDLGNPYAYNAQGITDEMVESKMKELRYMDTRENVPETDPHARGYDGVPQSPGTRVELNRDIEGRPVFITVDDINDQNLSVYMKRAANILDNFKQELKNINKQYKMLTPNKVRALQELAKKVLEAKDIYTAVINSNIDELAVKIANNRLKDVDIALSMVGYPAVMKVNV